MGNSLEPQSKSQDVMNKYTLIKSISEGKRLYKNKKTEKQFISFQRTFPTSQLLLEYQQRMRKTLEVKHPYFLNETEHAMITSSTMCSMHYRVIHYFQYEPHTLEQELVTRKEHSRHFQEKEIWSILCSAVLAMSYLTKQDYLCYNLHPKNIVIDKLGMIKILSPLLVQNGPQIIQEGLYYSPEHLKAFKTSNFSTLTNKSSVFTLGISILHVLSLEPMNQLYDYENHTINMELLNQLIEKLSQVEIKKVIKKMLKFHTYDRITFTELQQMLCNILEGENNQLNQSKISHETQVNEDTTERFTSSIHRLYQSGENQTQRPWNQVNKTSQNFIGSTKYLKQNGPILSFLPQFQDTPNLPAYESNIDTQNLDEQDVLQKGHQGQNFGNSILMQNKVSILNDSRFSNLGYSECNKKILQERTYQNTLIPNNNSMQKIKNQVQSKYQSRGQQNSFDIDQTSRPFHVKQYLSLGIYQGYKLNNYRHGYGVFYYNQGGKYAGQWFKNKMQGRGALYYANDQIAYEGEWLNDKLHGYGILYNQIPTYISNPFDFKSLHLVDNFWTKYEGNFYQDQKNGEGTLFLPNGEYYRGPFKEGLPHGNGIYKMMNGNIIKGVWILGMMQ